MKKLYLFVAVLFVVTQLFFGCSGKDAETAPSSNTSAKTSNTSKTDSPSSDNSSKGNSVSGSNNSYDDEEDYSPYPDFEHDEVEVSTIEEFIAAIRPNREIILRAGEYNISEFVRQVHKTQSLEEWNRSHEWRGLKENGGLELYHMHDLSIFCSENATFVSEFDSPTVLSFEDFVRLDIDGITTKHRASGGAPDFGNSIYMAGCSDVSLYRLNTEGIILEHCSNITIRFTNINAGGYGIRCQNTKNIDVSNSTFRHCMSGVFNITNCEGDLKFTSCIFEDNYSGGKYEQTKGGTLSFDTCLFGEKETETWISRSDASFDTCTFAEVDSLTGSALTNMIVGYWYEYTWPNNTLTIKKTKKPDEFEVEANFGGKRVYSGIGLIGDDGLFFALETKDGDECVGAIIPSGTNLFFGVLESNGFFEEEEIRDFVSSGHLSGDWPVKFYPSTFTFPDMEKEIKGTWYDINDSANKLEFTVDYRIISENAPDQLFPYLQYVHTKNGNELSRGSSSKPQEWPWSYSLWGDTSSYADMWFDRDEKTGELLLNFATSPAISTRTVFKKGK